MYRSLIHQMLVTPTVTVAKGGGQSVQTPTWVPTDLGANLIAYWDARVADSLFQVNDGTTAASSEDDPVAYWTDLSGNGNHLINTGATDRPLYKPTGVNGGPSVYFDGSNDFLMREADLFADFPFTVFALFQCDVAAAQDTVWSLGETTDSDDYFAVRAWNDPVGSIFFSEYSTGLKTAGEKQGMPHGHIMQMISDTSKKLRLDGAQEFEFTDNFPLWTDNGFALGVLVRSSPAHFLDGHIVCAGLINKTLNAEELDSLELWMAIGDDTRSITIAHPVPYFVYPRDTSDVGDITLYGHYSGYPTGIQARFNEGAWATIDESPTAGYFSGTLSNQAAGQGTLEVKFLNDATVTDSVELVGVGDVFLCAGQSNIGGRFTNTQSYSHATLTASMFDQTDDSWKELADPTAEDTDNGSVWPVLATQLMAISDAPLAVLNIGEGSTTLSVGDEHWAKLGDADNYNEMLRVLLASRVADLSAMLWLQGEGDANGGATKEGYQTALSLMLDDIQADSGLSTMKMIAGMIATHPTPTDAAVDNVRMAQADRWGNDADIYPGPTGHDQDFTDDLHWKTDPEGATLAGRWIRAFLAFRGGAESARGPQVSTVTRSGTTVTVTFTGGEGNLVNADDPTGFEFTDDGTPIAITGSAANGTDAVDLTLDSAPSGTELLSFCNNMDGQGATLQDSGTYPLPPEPFYQHAVS